MDYVWGVRKREMSVMTPRSWASAAGSMELLYTDIKIGRLMRCLTFMHVKFKILTLHPTELSSLMGEMCLHSRQKFWLEM